jgi:hypothetical protein
MANPLPDQELNLAVAASPDGKPSPTAYVLRDTSSERPTAAKDDLSAEAPTTAATVWQEHQTEVRLVLKIRKLVEFRLRARGSTRNVAVVSLLVVLVAVIAACLIVMFVR